MLWFTMRTVSAVVVEVGQREGFWEEKKRRESSWIIGRGGRG